ncbi:helix-turn-helix domain-containing protein [Halalkaliarchaeum sp. AArc-GB]|uniref:helix-turn-helix domain-containing protein n=1 Tax=Halalkaliarchaeum sp. AArc-GB TaxID=3074078 RepID=UPI0028602B59|nr:helix-turn-helix domain-containing protein [Halalkaliarchaeum sp. AArc-GB]MDR5674081.1 helix-turn-helix domain-containing protein [Halalkaliarchaeum sp. AArc-GB]
MSIKEYGGNTGGSIDRTKGNCARLELRLRPGPAYSCPLTRPFGSPGGEPRTSRRLEGTEVSDIQFARSESGCLIDFVLESGEVVSMSGREENASCLCDTFQRFDCVPKYTGVSDGWLHVTTHISDRNGIRPLVTELKSTVESVAVDRLVVSEPGNCGDLVLFDRSTLTEKQREAVEVAVERGYFKSGADVHLEEIAGELDISKSALSERLRTAQSKLVTDLF